MNTGKQINAMVVLLLILLLGVGVYTLWDPFRAEGARERTQEDMAERAAKTYVNNCINCHGDQGQGRIGPALNPEYRRANGLTDWTDPTKLTENQALIRNVLVCGRIGSVMPAWSQEQGGSLTDEQIRRLVILLATPPEGAWEHLEELAIEHELEVPTPPVEEVLAGAVITGSFSSVCGQKVVATPEPDTGPVTVQATWDVIATDNKFNTTGIGVPANQQVTVNLRNNGAALHNWAVQGVNNAAGQNISTQLLPGGQSETLRFTVATPGTYNYLCTVHPTEMRGRFVVQ